MDMVGCITRKGDLLTECKKGMGIHRKATRIKLLRLLLLYFVALLAPAKGQCKSPATSLPPIANLLGVRVGQDTIERLEHRFGKGYAYTGGHPGGARRWRIKGTYLFIDADGFDYDEHGGRIIDKIEINREPLDKYNRSLPWASVSKRARRFLGSLRIGMHRGNVLKVLRKKHLAAKENKNSLVL